MRLRKSVLLGMIVSAAAGGIVTSCQKEDIKREVVNNGEEKIESDSDQTAGETGEGDQESPRYNYTDCPACGLG